MFKHHFIKTLFILILFVGFNAQASRVKEIVTSATYGVMAGSLVGAAALAFTNQPGDNLQMVARGASLGLYLGIALGLYVAYWVPGLDSTDPLNPMPIPTEDDSPYNEGESMDDYSLVPKVYPLISDRGQVGLGATWQF